MKCVPKEMMDFVEELFNMPSLDLLDLQQGESIVLKDQDGDRLLQGISEPTKPNRSLKNLLK